MNGETWRLKRLANGDPNARFETNEIDTEDFARGGDGIVYASSPEEADEIRNSLEESQ
jgi:hypothetical protein